MEGGGGGEGAERRLSEGGEREGNRRSVEGGERGGGERERAWYSQRPEG